MVGALVGAVIWNHRNATIATDGIQFEVPVPAGSVARTITSIYGGGTRSAARKVLWGIDVTASGGNSFVYRSRIGDEGTIEVTGNGSGCRVRAYARSLYVGSHPMTHSGRGGLWGFSSYLTHGIYRVLGITPSAAKLKR